MDTHKRIGAALRAERQDAGVTQAYIAKFVGCSPSAVCCAELGKFASLELIEALCWALGMDIGQTEIGRPRAVPKRSGVPRAV